MAKTFTSLGIWHIPGLRPSRCLIHYESKKDQNDVEINTQTWSQTLTHCTTWSVLAQLLGGTPKSLEAINF